MFNSRGRSWGLPTAATTAAASSSATAATPCITHGLFAGIDVVVETR